MRGYVITAVGIVALVAALLLFFLRGERYALVAQNGEGEYVYKIDKATGRVWFISGDVSDEVRDFSALHKAQTPEEQAISLAKIHRMPGNTNSMDQTIKDWLQSEKGLLRIYGWKAKRVDDQTYLVGYTYDEGPGSSGGGWVFEVNLKAEIVRNVIGDADLEKKYVDWVQSLEKKSNASHP
jgi:hypothetical protein